MKLKNKFIIIVPVYNARELIIECLESIINQSFDDLGVIIRDDMSTDGTDEIIKSFFGTLNNEEEFVYKNRNIIFKKNLKKFYPLGNTYDSVINFTDNKESIIGVVDGDDKLVDLDAIQKIYNVYDKKSKWLVWSQHKNSNGSIGQSRPLPTDTQIYSNRNYWSVTHFRTSKAGLFFNLRKEDLKDPFTNDEYFSFAGDAAFLYPFCEMCGNEKSFFLNDVLYQYNNNLPTNEHNKNINNAIKYGMFIKTQGKKYDRLKNL